MKFFVLVAAALVVRSLLSSAGVDIPLGLILFLGAIARGIHVYLGRTRGDPLWERQWAEAADELGLRPKFRNSSNSMSTMRGEIDGHQVTVKSYRHKAPEIDVRFWSGLRSVDIDPRREGRRHSGGEVSTGDPAFDAAYRVSDRAGVSDEELHAWLTPARREILLVLGDALEVEEIEENELEVLLGRDEWTPAELVQAVELCVLVAKTLDKSYQPRRLSIQDASPQDEIRPDVTPQDRVQEPQDDRPREDL